MTAQDRKRMEAAMHTEARHVARLRTLEARNHGKLPSAKWLNEHGYFHSYDVVRKAGLLKNFKRAYAR